MEIEELFCKRYPEYSVNGKPLHPYFDVFEEGYEQAEKENAELKKKCYKKAVKDYCELEKENAELKEELKDANEKVVHLACNQNKDLKNKLTKAKEIIKEFVMWANWNGANCPKFKDIQSKAEQFLKDLEK